VSYLTFIPDLFLLFTKTNLSSYIATVNNTYVLSAGCKTKLPPKANTPDFYWTFMFFSLFKEAINETISSKLVMNLDFIYIGKITWLATQVQQPVASYATQLPTVEQVRGRVAVTAAEQLCLFAVTLQWSTQGSAAWLTAERYRVTLIFGKIQPGCFILLLSLLLLLSPSPMRDHSHGPPNSAFLYLLFCASF